LARVARGLKLVAAARRRGVAVDEKPLDDLLFSRLNIAKIPKLKPILSDRRYFARL
jgi:hypothetical protein